MSRRKQVVPKRRADAAEPESGVAAKYHIHENASPLQAAPQVPQEASTKKHRTDCSQLVDFTVTNSDSIAACAEFIIATRRHDEGDNGAAEVDSGSSARQLTIRVLQQETHHADSTMILRDALLVSWGDGLDMQHKVLLQLPSDCRPFILHRLQQCQVQLSCQPIPAAEVLSLLAEQQLMDLEQQAEQQHQHKGQQLPRCKHTQQQQDVPVQYHTQEVPSSILDTYKSDVILVPTRSAIAAAIKQCEAVAAAATACLGDGLQPCTTVLLPARHISLMAAAALADRSQGKQQQQSGCQDPQESSSSACESDSTSLLLWRMSIGLPQQRLFSDTDWHACHAEQETSRLFNIRPLFRWLVPHWVPNLSTAQQPWGLGATDESSNSDSPAFDAADLYSAVKPRGDEPLLVSTPPELLPTLRPYQRRAVAWMLAREGVPHQRQQQEEPQDTGAAGYSSDSWYSKLVQQQLHPLWRCGLLLGPPATSSTAAGSFVAHAESSNRLYAAASQAPDSPTTRSPDVTGGVAHVGSNSSAEAKRVIYFCPETGLVSLKAFEAPKLSGGILADEMGLGKTVELLALISTNRFKSDADSTEGFPTILPATAAGGTVAKATYDPNCCSRCGEELDSGYYTKDGWVAEKRGSSRGAGLDSPCVSDGPDDDPAKDDDYQPGKRRRGSRSSKAKQKQSPTAVSKTPRRCKQQLSVDDLDDDVGYHGAKRQRLNNSSRRTAPQRQQQPQGWDQCLPHAAAVGPSIAAAGAAGGVGGDVWVVGGSSGSSSGGLVCSACLRDAALQEVHEPCGTTLIVVPSNILVQWVDELLRHITPGTLTLKVYVGQYQPGAAAPAAPAQRNSRKHAAAGSDVRSTAAAAAGAGAAAAATAAGQVVTAAELAAADVVVTTYDVLKRELALQPGIEATDRSLRRKKRYAIVPTPLSRLCFWRLVLDEAQQVQGSTAKAAEMSRLLQATHRWAVTGTPISRGVEDLHGTLSCLQAEPWAGSSSWWWRRAIAEPLASGGPDGWYTLLRVMCPRLGGVLWRSAKADVLCEMGLPPQAQHTTLLRLSAIERHWYNRAHQDCAAKARKVLQDAITKDILARRQISASTPTAAATAAKAAAARAAAAAIAAGGDGRELDASSAVVLDPLLDRQLLAAEQKRLLLPLLRLRQACLHPQVGAAGLRAVLTAGGSSSSTPLTMDQILTVLTTKAKTEAEEAQRQLIGALNGLAALMRLSDDCAAAVTAYRQGLATAEANKQEVRTDPLQLLHTLHNLHELLQHLAQKYNTGSTSTSLSAGQGFSSAPAPYGPGVARTLRDDALASEAAAIQRTYLTQRLTDLQAAAEAYLRTLREALPGRHHRGLGLRAHRQVEARGTRQQDGAAGAAATGARKGAAGAGSSSSVWQHAMMGEGENEDLDWLEEAAADAASDDDDDDDADEGGGNGASGSGGLTSGWYVSVIDMLQSSGAGDEMAEIIREKLQEADTYRQKVAQNATSFANRFDTLHGLKLLLSQELSALQQHQAAALEQLEQLHQCCTAPGGPQQQFIEQAGQCGRCRSDMGVAGLVCRHCRLDEQMRKWEMRLFSLHTRALVAGTQIDAEAAADQAQAAALRRVGQGGLNEAAGEHGSAAAAADGSGRRQDTSVSETQIVRHPNEVERVLRLLQQQIGRQGLARYLPGVAESASAHLDRLEGSRRLFTAAGAFSVAQRQLLYAHDELAMSLLRIETRTEDEQVTLHQALFRLTEAEQVIKNSELSLERVLAEADLKRALGKLRYLKTIAAARKRAVAAAASETLAEAKSKEPPGRSEQRQQPCDVTEAIDKPSPRVAAAAAAIQRAAAAGEGGSDAPAALAQEGKQQQQQQQQQVPGQPTEASTAAESNDGITQDNCPICHDKVEAAAAVLPCGHVLCCSCADGLTARIPAAVPQPQRRINCPTCRARAHVSDVAYVDSGRSSTYAYISTDSSIPAAGDKLASLGSPRRRSSSDAGSNGSTHSYCWQGEQQLIVSGSYGTKIEALLRRLLFLLQQDAGSRVIVFSSWQDGLDIVSHALQANGVAHAYGRGRKGFLRALQQFKGSKVDEAEAIDVIPTAAAAAAGGGGCAGAELGDSSQEQQCQQPHTNSSDHGQVEPTSEVHCVKPAPASASAAVAKTISSPGWCRRSSSSQDVAGPRVLLLLLQQGAAGLNLTEAQHVVLLEPLLDPAQELQAMGRVNRFGQTRTTHVHRFVVEHTIEENVAALCRQRAAAMDMSAAVPVKRGSSGGSSSGGVGDAADLTVRDIAALLCTKWREGEEGEETGAALDITAGE